MKHWFVRPRPATNAQAPAVAELHQQLAVVQAV